MAISEREAKRVLAEGGSVFVSGPNGGDPIQLLSVGDFESKLPQDFKWGDEVTLDSPEHPANQPKMTEIPTDTGDPTYQQYLNFVAWNKQAHVGGAASVYPIPPSVAPEDAETRDFEAPDTAASVTSRMGAMGVAGPTMTPEQQRRFDAEMSAFRQRTLADMGLEPPQSIAGAQEPNVENAGSVSQPTTETKTATPSAPSTAPGDRDPNRFEGLTAAQRKKLEEKEAAEDAEARRREELEKAGQGTG